MLSSFLYVHCFFTLCHFVAHVLCPVNRASAAKCDSAYCMQIRCMMSRCAVRLCYVRSLVMMLCAAATHQALFKLRGHHVPTCHA